jgi:hypothetical protein
MGPACQYVYRLCLGPLAYTCHKGNHKLIQLDDKNNKCPIYSLSVHPDGTRLATGGLGMSPIILRLDRAKHPDHKVKIWSTLPVLDESADDETNPKLLCTMTTHSGMLEQIGDEEGKLT